jgi:hypothetical protein
VARQVLPIVGAAIGAYFGGPQGAQIGFMIGSVVGNAVDPVVVDGPKIGDVAAQTSAEGVYQPIFFGTCSSAGNIIDQGPNIIRKKKDSSKGGGPVTVSERLYKSFAIRIGCGWNGPIAGITRIWEDGKLVFDMRPETEIFEESQEYAKGFRVYLGTEDQLPDPELEAIHGVDNVPAYVGRAYIVFIKKDITDRRSIPDFRFEVATNARVIDIDALMLVRTIVARTAIPSPDGRDWTAPAYPPGTVPSISRLIGANDRYVGYPIGSSGLPWYSTNLGQTWTQSTGTPFVARGNGSYLDGVYLIPTDEGIARSDDGAQTWNLHGPSSFRFAAQRLGIAVSTNGANLFQSIDTGNTWSLGASLSGLISIGSCWATDGDTFLFGGSWLGQARAIRSINGLDASLVTIPFESGDSEVTCIAYGKGMWLLGTSAGRIYRDIGAGFDLMPWTAHGPCRDMKFIGSGFVVTSLGDSTFEGRVQFTADGESATDQPLSGSYEILDLATLEAVEMVVGAPINLDEAVAAIHGMVNQPVSRYDVTDLDGILLEGLTLSGGYTAGEAIRSLAGTFLFDSPEYDGKIRHRRRGKPVVVTLTFDDLVDEPEESTRGQAIEYPRKMHLEFQNPDIDYAPAKETSVRESTDVRVVGEQNLQSPVTMNVDQAAQLVRKLHKVAWEDAKGEVTLRVPDSFLSLVASDCVGLVLRGSERRLRIERMELEPGSIKLTLRHDRQSAYTANVTGIPRPPPTPPPPSLVGPTYITVGDWPALRDQDDLTTPVRYVAMGGISPAWNGALAEQSTDGGANYSDMVEVRNGAIMGTLVNAVPSASPYYLDTTNKLTVQLDMTDNSVEIDSLTDQQFYSEGGGFALVDADGSFEIGQYRDAVDLGDGLYEFTTLMRGRLNTGAADHASGARFILLETVAATVAPTSQIGVDMYYRATSFGRSPELGTIVHGVFEGNSQREWPVANLLLSRPDADTVRATAIPRHRFGTEMAPMRSINWQGYHWVVSDGTNTIERSTVEATQDFDTTGWSSPVEVTVSQVNRITGDGPAVIEEIE